MGETEKYKVLAKTGLRHAGREYKCGEEIALTAEQAKYPVLNGTIVRSDSSINTSHTEILPSAASVTDTDVDA